MGWNNLVFSIGQTLPSSDMNKLYGNFDAVCAANSGAPPFSMYAFAKEATFVESTVLLYPGSNWIPARGAYQLAWFPWHYDQIIYRSLNSVNSMCYNAYYPPGFLMVHSEGFCDVLNTDSSNHYIYYAKFL